MDTGTELKEQVLEDLAQRNREWLSIVRDRAADIAFFDGHVTADDIRDFAASLDIKPSHKYAMGAVFRDKRFKQIGTKISSDPGHHGKAIILWGLSKVGEEEV